MESGSKKGFFGIVHIVESFPPRGLLPGKALVGALEHLGIRSKYTLVRNKKELRRALQPRIVLAKTACLKGSLPIVHLSMHGTDDGILLRDGTSISWVELREPLRKVNESLRGRLLVCMSSCWGLRGCGMAMRMRGGLPFLALVGYEGSLSLQEAMLGYATFYYRLFNNTSLTKAIKAMRAATGNRGFAIIPGRLARSRYRRRVAELLGEA